MQTADDHLLTVKNLTLDLSGRRILRDINLTVDAGEFLGLIGPNGGGKTSLLRVLVGIVAPTGGSVIWSGERRIVYVPQLVRMDREFPLSSVEIVKQGAPGSFPLFGWRRRDVNRRAEELIHRVGLAGQ